MHHYTRTQTYNIMDTIIPATGCLWGISHNFNAQFIDTLTKAPISTTLDCTICAIPYTLGAVIVGGIIPYYAKPVFAGVILATALNRCTLL